MTQAIIQLDIDGITSIYLVTGGAGFIGSHTCVSLLEEGHSVVVLDNLENSSRKSIEAVSRIANAPIDFIKGDIQNEELLKSIFSKAIQSGKPIEGVIHLAGLKVVGESVSQPLRYWDTNVLKHYFVEGNGYL